MADSILKCITSAMLFSLVATNASESTVRLSDHIPIKAIDCSSYLGHLNRDADVPITFTLPLRNQEALKKLLERIYDPTDALYGKYLSSEEFIEQFAPTQEDYDQLIAYAKSRGMTVVSTHANRTLLNARGSTNTVESAFNLQLYRYQLPSGRTFFAPNGNPKVPSSIASIITGIVGLHNHTLRKTYHHKKQKHSPTIAAKNFPSGPGGGFSPSDIVTAYNLAGIPNGSNQIIALLQLAGYQASDINTYAQYFGLPAPKLTNILVDGGSALSMSVEVAIDIELALALAPESQIYVYEGPNSDQGVLDTYNRIATDNIAKQVSTSWGLGEDLVNVQYLQSENAIFMQMAAQGQTMYAAAGDSGAYDDYTNNMSKNLVVDDPASQPYVVSVGGTRLTVNAATGAYEGETVWNEGLGNGAGGGGVSTVWPTPSWQTNIATIASKTHRNVPDVAFNADAYTGYAIYYDDEWVIYGGTSCAAPLWASFTANVNQKLAAEQMAPLGFANPIFYAIGTGAFYGIDFHDVTIGDNLFYKALVGYDNASGWGSFNGNNLFSSLTQLALAPQLSIAMSHRAPFARGGIGTYRIAVSNQGKASAIGGVQVTVSLPSGLSYNSFSGNGWSFDEGTFTFTENDFLSPGMSYPTILLHVNVAKNAPYKVIPTATVSGGKSPSSTVTNLTTTYN